MNYICEHCFADSALKTFIREHASSMQCTFCEQRDTSPIAMPFSVLVEYVTRCVKRDYALAEYSLPLDSDGYRGRVWSGQDLLKEQIGLLLPRDNGKLLDALAD